MTIQQQFEFAVSHHRAGRLADAERIYRHILSQKGDHAEALHLLGVLAAQAGRFDAAVDLLGRTISLRPDMAEARLNFGNALKGAGSIDAAIAAYREAIAIKPDFAEAHNCLGRALQEKKDLVEATKHLKEAVRLKPEFAGGQCDLATALAESGQLDAAAAAFGEAIRLRPGWAEAHGSLGNVLMELGRPNDALAEYREAIRLKPGLAEAHGNLGNALMEAGQLVAAVASYRAAIALKGDVAGYHNNLGSALKAAGECEAAVICFGNAIRIHNDFAEAHNNLGNALKELGRLDEAIRSCRIAISLRSDFAEGHNNLGHALKETGEGDEAIACFRRAIEMKPDFAVAHSNLLLALWCRPGLEAGKITDEHRQWNEQHAKPLEPQITVHDNNRDPDRRLRIGYVSPDFRKHVIAGFILPLLENHDREQCEVFGYANVVAADDMTRRLRKSCDVWRDVAGLSDAGAAELIARDRIDILIDLAGHTASNRLLVFARRPAPVQITYLGYPGTTGMGQIDYRLTDIHADPPGETERFHTEQLLRLETSAWCIQPRPAPPPVARDILRPGGPIVFGCFNNFSKVNEPLLRLWGRMMREVPDSRLMLKSMGLESVSARNRVHRILEEEGIAASRLEMRGMEKGHDAHLAMYGGMDIALDTFPYHGTTTTLEALWMGVPVVTLAGHVHVSRVGASLLRNIGLGQLVADSADEYLRIAISLARDMERLKEMRLTLRSRMEQSALMDGKKITSEIEAAYRRVWREWCGKHPGGMIDSS